MIIKELILFVLIISNKFSVIALLFSIVFFGESKDSLTLAVEARWKIIFGFIFFIIFWVLLKLHRSLLINSIRLFFNKFLLPSDL